MQESNAHDEGCDQVTHPVRSGRLVDLKSKCMQAIEDRHNAAKQQAESRLEEMGAGEHAEGPPSKAMMKVQLKRSEPTLRDTISEAQNHKPSPLVKELLTQLREKYREVIFKLEVTILSEEQALEEDIIFLRTTEKFLTRMLSKAKQATCSGALRGPAGTQVRQGD